MALSLEASFYLYPVFGVLMFLYVYKATGQFHFPFLITLISGMIAEIFFLIDFDKYTYLVSIAMIFCFLSMLYALREVMHFEIKNFPKHLYVEILLGVFSVTTFISYLAYNILPEIADLPVFLVSFVALLVFISLLYAIPLFNKHPSNLLLTFVATAVLVESAFAFIYTYILDIHFFLLVTLFCAGIAKVIFAMFLTRLESTKKIDEAYI